MDPIKVQPKILSTEAMQWTVENTKPVLEWLSNRGFGYSWHEIQSAGQLIVYITAGPVMVPFGHWIILTDTNLALCDDITFKQLYEVLDEPVQK